MSVWSWCGVAVSLVTALSATVRAFQPASNYYASGVYGMTRRTHAGYALAGFVLAGLSGLSLVRPEIPVTAILAAAVLLTILYFTSFLRGFSDEE